MQPVPSSVDIGPDGAYYVGELTRSAKLSMSSSVLNSPELWLPETTVTV